MRTLELQRRGIFFVEGQRNSYDPEFDIHNRSFICAYMDNELFIERIEPFLKAYGVRYVTQTHKMWDLREFGDGQGEVWVTRRHGKGRVRIELLDELIHLNNNEIYVVMWRRRFLPRMFKSARWCDIDTILLHIMDGRTRPPWFMRLFL